MDLKADYIVHAIRMSNDRATGYQDRKLTEFTIEISPSNQAEIPTFKEVSILPSPDRDKVKAQGLSGALLLRLAQPVRARYVLIRLLNSLGLEPRIDELEILGNWEE